MIKVTRLNGEEFVVNAEHIRYLEALPETHITMSSDHRIVVREPVEEVIERCIAYARSIRMMSGF